MPSLSALPLEVIQQIFCLCLPTDTFVTPDPLNAPLLLAQISSDYRQAALSVSQLWSSLSLQKNRRFPESAAFILESWLDRSCTHPLSLSLPRALLIDPKVQALFVRCSPRWRHIAAPIGENTPWDLKLIRNPLQSLQSFNLIIQDKLSPFQTHQLSSILRSAPHLKEVIWIYQGRGHYPLLDIGWHRFTDVQVSGHTGWAHLFNHGQNLVRLVHGNISLDPTPLVPDNALQHLRTLVIRSDEERLELLYQTLILPSLTSLQVHYDDWADSPRIGPLLLGLLRRSRCPLENLDLFNHPVLEAHLIQILRSVQNTLRELTIQFGEADFVVVGDSVLDLLSVDDPTTLCLCPRLVSLALYDCMTCTPGALARMIQSRQTHGLPQGSSVSPIQLVEIYELDDELKYLNPLRLEGLIIKEYALGKSLPKPLDSEVEVRLQKMYEDGFPKQQRHILNSSGYL